MTFAEIKELAKSAATAYIIGAHIKDPKLAVDKFREAYNYALECYQVDFEEWISKRMDDSSFGDFSNSNKHF